MLNPLLPPLKKFLPNLPWAAVLSQTMTVTGGYKLSSVPLSRLSQREQREASSHHSVPHTAQQLSVHLSICFWSPVCVCVSVCLLTQLSACLLVYLWSICLSDGTRWQDCHYIKLTTLKTFWHWIMFVWKSAATLNTDCKCSVASSGMGLNIFTQVQ